MEENTQSQNQTQGQPVKDVAGEGAAGGSSGEAADNIKASIKEVSGAAVDGSVKDVAARSTQGETASAAQRDETGKTTVTESIDLSNDSVLREIGLSRYKRPFNEKTATNLNRAGLYFMLVASGILIVLTATLYKTSSPNALTNITRFENNRDLLNYYLYAFSGPIILFMAALISAGIGYALMRAAGTATKQVVNPEDMDLVALLLANNKQSFIDDYVRLSSLAGFTGMFTKVGLYGLPLATIVLTIVFTILAMLMPSNQQSLFDLAKLTLGAFIGSYVQRQSVETQAHDIRKQVTDVQNKMTDVQTKLTTAQSKAGA